MLHDLQRMGPGDEQFADRLDDFIAAVGHHVEEEETTTCPPCATPSAPPG